MMNSFTLSRMSLPHKYIIADGHVDLPFRLKMKNFRVRGSTWNSDQLSGRRLDYERAKKGGLSAPFMSIYIPASYQLFPDKGKALADSLINMVAGMLPNIPDKFALLIPWRTFRKISKMEKFLYRWEWKTQHPWLMILKNVQYFYDRGIRYMTLTHSKDNQICDSSGDTTHTWNGLSPFGIEVVKEMNRVGMMVDISHVDDSTFYQVMKLTKVPCIASHSSARFFAPTVRRDMTDDMIKKLGENDGGNGRKFLYGIYQW